jgi:uncharacterized protein (TIGR00730 family)
MKFLGVFCGARVGNDPCYAAAARQVGELLLAHRWGLVFGGGHIGLMGVLADVVLAGGGTVVGVIPQELVDRELAHRGVTQLHIVPTLQERKTLMFSLADAFLTLPGGYGTADELFEALTAVQLGLCHKPVGLLNVAGFFTPLLAWLDQAVACGFLADKHRQLLHVGEEAKELLPRLLREGVPGEGLL